MAIDYGPTGLTEGTLDGSGAGVSRDFGCYMGTKPVWFVTVGDDSTPTAADTVITLYRLTGEDPDALEEHRVTSITLSAEQSGVEQQIDTGSLPVQRSRIRITAGTSGAPFTAQVTEV